jgi:hypothetical protein
VVKHSPNTHKVIGSIPSTEKNKTNKQTKNPNQMNLREGLLILIPKESLRGLIP